MTTNGGEPAPPGECSVAGTRALPGLLPTGGSSLSVRTGTRVSVAVPEAKDGVDDDRPRLLSPSHGRVVSQGSARMSKLRHCTSARFGEVNRRLTILTATSESSFHMVNRLQKRPATALRPPSPQALSPGLNPFSPTRRRSAARPRQNGVSPRSAVRHVQREWQLLRFSNMVTRCAALCALLQVLLAVGTAMTVRSQGDRRNAVMWYDIANLLQSALSFVQIMCVVKSVQATLATQQMFDPLRRDVSVLRSGHAASLLTEVFFLTLHEPPFLRFAIPWAHKLNTLAILRLFLVLRGIRTFSFSTTQAGSVISALARCTTSLSFELRVVYLVHPRAFVAATWASGWVIFACALYVVEDCEGRGDDCMDLSFGQAVWLAFITMTTVGYGDVSPNTVAGKVVACASVAFGLICTALVINLVTEGMALSGRHRRLAAFFHTARKHQQLEQVASRIVGLRLLLFHKRRTGNVNRAHARSLEAEVAALCARFRKLRRDFATLIEEFHQPSFEEGIVIRRLAVLEQKLDEMASARSCTNASAAHVPIPADASFCMLPPAAGKAAGGINGDLSTLDAQQLTPPLQLPPGLRCDVRSDASSDGRPAVTPIAVRRGLPSQSSRGQDDDAAAVVSALRAAAARPHPHQQELRTPLCPGCSQVWDHLSDIRSTQTALVRGLLVLLDRKDAPAPATE